MSTKVTVKGQVTLPKAVREAAGIRPGDKVEVRVRADGGVIVERTASEFSHDEYLKSLEAMSRRKPFNGYTTEDVMEMTRSEV